MAEQLLAEGYREIVPGGGKYVSVSSDDTRVFRMGKNDIMGSHSGGRHVNFKTLIPNPSKPGKMMVNKNYHIYLED